MRTVAVKSPKAVVPEAKMAVKAKAVKTPAASHPVYAEMIAKAIVELKERSGSSRAAILKYIQANYNVGDSVKQVSAHLRTSLKSGVANGSLKQVKGTGANGSFKLGEKGSTTSTKTVKKAVKQAKAAPAQKTKSPKKVAAKPEAKVVKKAASKTSKKAVVAKKAPAVPKKQLGHTAAGREAAAKRAAAKKAPAKAAPKKQIAV